MALISAVAYTLWGILLKYNPVSKVSIFGFTNPVFGVILSAIILREGNVFGMKDLIALVLVSIGILIVNWAKPVGEKEKGMNLDGTCFKGGHLQLIPIFEQEKK